MRLTICRHGETDLNVQRRLQGRIETSLNARGKMQALLLAEKLKAEEFDHVFCSPQKRCRQTIAKIMAFHKANKVSFRNELKEIDVGKYCGMSQAEIEAKYSGDWVRRVDNKYDFVHEGGESYKSVDENRVKPLLKEFAEKYSSRKILVMTHQGLARLIVGNLLGLSQEEKMRVTMPNDCIYYIEYRPHKTAIKYFLCESKEESNGFLKR